MQEPSDSYFNQPAESKNLDLSVYIHIFFFSNRTDHVVGGCMIVGFLTADFGVFLLFFFLRMCKLSSLFFVFFFLLQFGSVGKNARSLLN